MWPFIAILQWGAQSIPKPYVFLLCRIIKVFKQKERGKPKYFSWLIKYQMAPLLSLQNCQVTKSIKTYTLRESLKRFAKYRMSSHELSHLSEKDNQSVFFEIKKKSKSQKEERMSWALHSFHDSKPFALLDTKPTFTTS